MSHLVRCALAVAAIAVLFSMQVTLAQSSETQRPTRAEQVPAVLTGFLVSHRTPWAETHFDLASNPCQRGYMCVMRSELWQIVPATDNAAAQLRRLAGRRVSVQIQQRMPGAPGHEATVLANRIGPATPPAIVPPRQPLTP